MRERRAAQVLLVGLLVGVCWAEGGEIGGPADLDPSFLAPEVVDALFLATAGTAQDGDYPVLELAKEASRIYAMRSGGAVDAGEFPPISACAFADGSSGVPKIGGGGEDMLGPREKAAGLAPSQPAPLAPGGPAWMTMVIIDEFDFGQMAGGDVHTVDMSAGAGGTTLGPDDLLHGTGSTNPLDPPHGNLVIFHILRLMAPTGPVTFQRLPITGPAGQALWTVGMPGRTLALIDVDYDDGDSVLSSLGLIARGAVVNLSWNIFECQIIDDYQLVSDVIRDANASGNPTTPIPTLLDYLKAALATVQSNSDFEGLCTGLMPQPPPAPALTNEERCASVLALAAVLEMEHFAKKEYFADLERLFDPDEGPVATLFAAAGNQGLTFALAPASWQGVNAVAACFQTTEVSSKAQFSNAPLKLGGPDADYEFTAPGAWFAVDFTGPSGEPLGYWGTSFAAPHVAILSASGTLAATPAGPAKGFPGCAP